MNKERIEKIRYGWVTNYPNPEFTGDKVGYIVSVNQAHDDIKFLLEEIDNVSLFSLPDKIMFAGMNMTTEFKNKLVYWVGWDCGSYEVFGPDRVLGRDYKSGKYQLSLDSCLLTNALPISEHVYLTKEEAEKKCEELKNESKK